ncbi:MAG TPA: VIT family protein, partial [bacterium]|nr:VIT family protein [bacterium]
VLGANDGIVSTAGIVVGVSGAALTGHALLASGLAGVIAGALSMAAGEYVSVSSQADTEQADLARERAELATQWESEREELQRIYVARGLDTDLALQVADQLMTHDALGAHARDELGLSEIHNARPVQAAFASAGTFAVGAGLPLAVALLAPVSVLAIAVVIASLLCLAFLGGLAARTGGAKAGLGALRVTFWGALAMALTWAVGALFGTTVS